MHSAPENLAMPRGMQDACTFMHAESGACKQTVSRESDRPPPTRRSLLRAENTIGPPNDSLPPLVNMQLTGIVHPFCPLRSLPCGVACRANSCAIRVSSLTPCFASAFFSTNRQDPLQSRAVNYRGEIQNHSGTRTKRPTL